MSETAHYLAVGAVSLMHTIDPDIVLFGGGMIAAGEAFLEEIRIGVRAMAFPVPAAKTRIEYAQLGGEAGFIGAAGWARAKRKHLTIILDGHRRLRAAQGRRVRGSNACSRMSRLENGRRNRTSIIPGQGPELGGAIPEQRVHARIVRWCARAPHKEKDRYDCRTLDKNERSDL